MRIRICNTAVGDISTCNLGSVLRVQIIWIRIWICLLPLKPLRILLYEFQNLSYMIYYTDTNITGPVVAFCTTEVVFVRGRNILKINLSIK
jgi:hypothetical protein